MLGAAALGAVFGVATGPRIPKRGEFGGACEIPLKVLRLGMLLGAAEGGLAGAFFGGASGAVLGLALGLTYGHIFAAYSWRIRQRARVYVLALLASAFVEALGALAIGVLDYLMWRKGFTPAVFPVALLASLALQPIANRRN
jgi:hypothetical protein